MSWIKKIFGTLKRDTYEEEVEEVPIQQEKEGRKSDAGREVDAKIAYQYPKGQFRFPLIPDGNSLKQKRKPRAERQVHTEEDDFPPQAEEKIDKPSFKQKPKEPLKPITKEPLTRNERQAASMKRPFQPTQIPSPIYGFKRPIHEQASEQPIEFELSSDEKQENNITVFNEPVATQEYEAILDDNGAVQHEEEMDSMLEANNKTISVAAASASEETEIELESVQQPIINSTHREESPFNKKEVVQLSEETEADYGEAESSTVMSVHQAELLLNEQEAIQASEETIENFEEEPGLFTAAVDQEESLQNEETAIQMSEEIALEAEEETSPILTSIHAKEEPSERNATGTETNDHHLEIAEPSASEYHHAAEQVDVPQQRAVRSHIPFNVIMLNKDRQKLQQAAQKKQSDEPQQQIAASISHEELHVSDCNEVSAEINDHQMEKEEQQIAGAYVHPAEQEHNLQQNPQPRAARSHIPFNVIMLNKDRQRLQQAANMLPKKDHTIKAEPVQEEKETEQIEELPFYVFPEKELLSPPVFGEESTGWLKEQEELLNSTLANFNVRAHVVNVTEGPSVTRFEVQPEPGVKVNKITNLSDDIKLSLAARDIRIEAPIPGKHTIGIEVPNRSSRPVFISEIINSEEFQQAASPLTAVLGLDIAGKPIVTDLRKMPHGLIAGATGSGKSVCINTLLVSLLFKATPDELKLLLIDPKMVELAPYNRIPHLVSPVITDVKAATAALKWAVEEMERRYELFVHAGVRDIGRYNEMAEAAEKYSDKIPYIVIIIDELADLMMMSPADVEEAICRIAQKARACGIHLIIATQRPSVDVITGLIKANVPTRVAFSVSSQIDSRTIIDISGAEKLLGKGDMLFLENGSSKPVRLQGTFVSDQEIDAVVAHVRKERQPAYLFEQEELLKKAEIADEEDELFYEACEFVVLQGSASTSSLQRRFKIGYSRAARLIDMMEKLGYISETRGSKPRDVYLNEADLEALAESSTL